MSEGPEYAAPGRLGDSLPGGNVGDTRRVGEFVHRPTGPWTPAVHALLTHLARGDLPHLPTVHGFDDHGREVLSYLPGRVVDVDTELLTDDQLRSLVGWTRHLHTAVAGFTHPGPWRFFEVAEPTLVGHNDIAPYNVCFAGDDLAGVFDWDFAGPTTALLELALIAWNCVPLFRDVGAGTSAGRLELIAATYGGCSAADILDAVPARIRLMLEGIPAAAAAGDDGIVRLMATGEPARSARALDGLMERLPQIAALLR